LLLLLLLLLLQATPEPEPEEEEEEEAPAAKPSLFGGFGTSKVRLAAAAAAAGVHHLIMDPHSSKCSCGDAAFY
jgi:hypothetical protein